MESIESQNEYTTIDTDDEKNLSIERKATDSNIIKFPASNLKNDVVQNNSEAYLLEQISNTNLLSEKTTQKQKRIDELSNEQIESFAEKHRLVLKIQSGLTVPQACREIGWDHSIRSAYNLWENFQKIGKVALKDKRWQRVPECRILTEDVKNLILGWYYERSAAGPRAIWTLTCQSCEELGFQKPAETTVKNFLNKLSVGEKLIRQRGRGLKLWQKKHASVIEQNKTTFSNQLWQGDHTELPIWLRRKINGIWEVDWVYASVLLDDYSRANPGFWLSHKYPDAWSISILYRQAIVRKEVPGLHACGLPFSTESDRGTDWISNAVQTMLKSLGVQPIIDPAYFPNSKGKIERFFRFLDTSLLTTLPGHKKDVGTTIQAAKKRVMEFLTLEQLREEINKWRVWYHMRVHGETDRKPIELWEETVHFRYPESEDDLNILLLKYDRERTILNRGVKLVIDKIKHLYWSPAFDLNTQRRVRIRYNPEDTDSVLLYCAEANEFICEAWDTRAEHPRYTLADVKKSRHAEKQRLQSLLERSKQYYKNVLNKDRLVEQRKEWEQARDIAAQLPSAEPETNLEEEELTNTMEMLRRLQRGLK